MLQTQSLKNYRSIYWTRLELKFRSKQQKDRGAALELHLGFRVKTKSSLCSKKWQCHFFEVLNVRIRLQGFASQFLAGSEFPSAGLTIFAYGENLPMGVRYLSVTKAPACGFYSGNQRFPEPFLAMQMGLSTV